MTNDLFSKVTALLEAREKATPPTWERAYFIDGPAYADRTKEWKARLEQEMKHRIRRSPEAGPFMRWEGTNFYDDMAFAILVANTSTEIITGYHDLVRRMAEAMEESYKRLNAAGYAVGEARIALLEEARAAITHKSTNS